jgi:spore germination protein GerM
MCGSCDIYSQEYKCTRVEIDVTTISITAVKGSNRKPQLTTNNSDENQRNKEKQHVVPDRPTSKNIKQEVRKVKKIQLVEIKRAPFAPTNLPKKPQTIELNSGKNNIFKYIFY